MKFSEKTREARFLKRYKRFFADVHFDDQVVVAHVPNTGSLKTCLYDNANCIVTETSDPSRKLKATLQFVQTPTGWAGVNTALPNMLVHEAWESQLVEGWRDHKAAKREYKISKETRLDLVLAKTQDDLAALKDLHHVEIKNVTLVEGDCAMFPDCETTRGQKHLRELMALKEAGHGAEIVFVIQREGIARFKPADDLDPEYGRLLREARDRGVTISAYACDFDPLGGVTLNTKPIALDF